MHPIIRRSLLLAALVTSSGATAAAHAQDDTASVPLYDNLGTHHYRITTAQPTAQLYFDQGLRLYFGFNHAEAIRAFEKATRIDPTCAMCHWGIALAYGPNINMPMDSAAAVAAYQAIRRAEGARANASPDELALIDALSTRYAAVPPNDRAALDSAFARAMGDVAKRFPTNLEARTLYAESLMDLSPWHYWTRDGDPRPDTPELLGQLEQVLASNPDHPGANHFYIHAVEAVDPARAVPMAERLARLMPGAGHIVHMPGHIYVRVGRYVDAIAANEHAVYADETFIRDQKPGLGMYTAGYYPHNHDFLAFAASMIGRREQAIEAAETLPTLVPAEMMHVRGMTFLQHHRTRHLQLKVRFAEWNDILAAPEPDASLPHARAMWNYARGRALAATGDVQGATGQLTLLRAVANDSSVGPLRLEFNTSGQVLAVASEVLAGRIAEARGDHAEALARLQEAARLEDAMVYGEPPEWTVPVRHDLGAVQLAAGHAADAEATYRQDLKRFPENGWSLRGLALSLAAQGEHAEAAEVERRFAAVWQGDPPVRSAGR